MSEVHKNGIVLETEGKTDLTNGTSSPAQLTEYMRECLVKVAASEGFIKYELKVDQGSAVGDGFVGLIYKVTIQETGSDRNLPLVLKFPPTSKARREDLRAMDLFKREVFVYSELLPELEKLQREKNIEKSAGFYEFPKCYFAEYNDDKDDSLIIMEDLRENSYRLYNKFIPTDFQHTKLVVSALGKFHAISFALKAQKPEIFATFKQQKDFLFKEMFNSGNMKNILISCIQEAAETIEAEDFENREKVLILKRDYEKIVEEIVDFDLAEPYAVMGHGDCWSNNFMYQYEGEAVQKVTLLDWQLCRYVSPALDLVHFIFGCTDGDMRAKHYDQLLKTYHQSLADLLDRLGGNTEKQFPFTALLEQLKTFGKFGLLMGAMIIPMSSLKNEDLPDMEVMAESINTEDAEKMEQSMSWMTKASDSARARLRSACLDSIRYGYL